MNHEEPNKAEISAASEKTKKRGNIANLKPIKSVEQARVMGRKGAIASQKTKKAKKTIRELAKKMMDNKIDPSKLTDAQKAAMDRLGIDAQDLCGKALMLAGLWKKACSGDAQAYDRICKAIGEADAAGDETVKINIAVGGESVGND